MGKNDIMIMRRSCYLIVYFGNEFDCLNDWLEIGNPKDEMENEWFMVGQQEVVPNKKMWSG